MNFTAISPKKSHIINFSLEADKQLNDFDYFNIFDVRFIWVLKKVEDVHIPLRLLVPVSEHKIQLQNNKKKKQSVAINNPFVLLLLHTFAPL